LHTLLIFFNSMRTIHRIFPAAVLLAAGLPLAACEDLSSFSTDEGEYYTGEVLDADIIRKGFEPGTELQMTFDVGLVEGDEEHVGPGQISTVPPEGGEVYFDVADLQPITSITHDQLSGFDFPTGRLRNYLFFANASGPLDGRLALVVVSLLSDGDVEVRIIMGAQELYGVFTLEKTSS
jgi:hypothetical protein